MDSGDPHVLESIIQDLKAGRDVFITGAGGTGKTWLVRHILEKIRKSN